MRNEERRQRLSGRRLFLSIQVFLMLESQAVSSDLQVEKHDAELERLVEAESRTALVFAAKPNAFHQAAHHRAKTDLQIAVSRRQVRAKK